MKRASLLRIIPIALLVFAITVPCARAEEPPAPKPIPAHVTDLLRRVWEGLVSLWMENGCGIDPDGDCTLGDGAEPTTDNGCIIDPDGHCRPGS